MPNVEPTSRQNVKHIKMPDVAACSRTPFDVTMYAAMPPSRVKAAGMTVPTTLSRLSLMSSPVTKPSNENANAANKRAEKLGFDADALWSRWAITLSNNETAPLTSSAVAIKFKDQRVRISKATSRSFGSYRFHWTLPGGSTATLPGGGWLAELPGGTSAEPPSGTLVRDICMISDEPPDGPSGPRPMMHWITQFDLSAGVPLVH
jgi:hypothetical protein